MKDIVLEKNGHITYFIWNVGPYLPSREKLAGETLKMSECHAIAGADYSKFDNGILSISFNPYATNEAAREIIEKTILSIISESHFDAS